MAREDVVKKWLALVHEDVSAAECMYGGGHWLYVAFLCHQAIEKVLKAYYCATHDDDPRYTHSHIRLVDDCGLTDKISDKHLRFMDRMAPMYIEARYPEQKNQISRLLNETVCLDIINTTKEFTLWIEQLLPNNKL